MRPVAILLILVGSLLLGGCKSTASSAASARQPECICGTHEARLHGCHAPACVSGAGNPGNPLCVCAPLKPAAAPAKGN